MLHFIPSREVTLKPFIHQSLKSFDPPQQPYLNPHLPYPNNPITPATTQPPNPPQPESTSSYRHQTRPGHPHPHPPSRIFPLSIYNFKSNI